MINSKPNENCAARRKHELTFAILFRIIGNNILIREHPCVLIHSGNTYANSRLGNY